MTNRPPKLCPECGQPIPDDKSKTKPVQDVETPEYDHRGIAMPRRTRVGGIIIPQ